MSVYNGEPYVDDAVASIVGQTFEDFEFIIINDGSTDGSGDHLVRWGTRDNRVRLVHQKNKGLTPSLNLGLSMARGDYVARMDADDISLPGRLEKQVAFLDEHHSVGVLGTNAEQIGKRGEHHYYSSLPTTPGHTAWSLLFFSPHYHSSVMMRKQVVIQAGGYNPGIPDCQDYDLWTRLTHVTDMTNLPEVCLKYRWWGSNMSIEKNDRMNADAAASAARLHTHYLKHRDHPAEKVARFFLDGDGEALPTGELISYFEHTVNLYKAFVSCARHNKDDLAPIKADLSSRLEHLARLTRRKDKFRGRLMRARVLQLVPSKIPDALRQSISYRFPG